MTVPALSRISGNLGFPERPVPVLKLKSGDAEVARIRFIQHTNPTRHLIAENEVFSHFYSPKHAFQVLWISERTVEFSNVT